MIYSEMVRGSPSGEGSYNEAVIWLDKADSIPLASADVREGVKVNRTC